MTSHLADDVFEENHAGAELRLHLWQCQRTRVGQPREIGIALAQIRAPRVQPRQQLVDLRADDGHPRALLRARRGQQTRQERGLRVDGFLQPPDLGDQRRVCLLPGTDVAARQHVEQRARPQSLADGERLGVVPRVSVARVQRHQQRDGLVIEVPLRGEQRHAQALGREARAHRLDKVHGRQRVALRFVEPARQLAGSRQPRQHVGLLAAILDLLEDRSCVT